ncbi:MAG: alpha/beta hydrolase [Pseudomonadota bacterium]
MTNWKLDETYKTTAGIVAAGRAGTGPDLVLAHGWPWSSFSWHRVIPELAKSFTVHWYDMPGYGKSDKSENQRTSLDVQGEVFAEMMTHWGLLRPNVVAHDFGGATTLRAHLLHGCEFNNYVLMNVVAMRPWGSEFFDHVRRHVDAFQGLPPHIHKAIVEAYIQGALVNDISIEDFDALVAPWLTEDGAPSFYRQFAQADEKYTEEIEAHFGGVRSVTKIIWGEDDPWIPLERGRALHQIMPKAEFATIPYAGHMPQLETTDAVLKEVVEFIK